MATLRADLSPASERGRMVRSAGATAALKVGATLLAFGASLNTTLTGAADKLTQPCMERGLVGGHK